MKKLWAFFLLSLYLLRTMAAKPLALFRRRNSRAPVLLLLGYYREDRLEPMSPRSADWMNQAGRCLACGLCDALCVRISPSGDGSGTGGGVGPSFVALSLTRDPSRWAEGTRAVSDLGRSEDYRAFEGLCPAGLPLPRIVEEYRRAVAPSS